MALITLKQLLDHAADHQYGLPAFNINNMEQGLAIMEAANELNAPVLFKLVGEQENMQMIKFYQN